MGLVDKVSCMKNLFVFPILMVLLNMNLLHASEDVCSEAPDLSQELLTHLTTQQYKGCAESDMPLLKESTEHATRLTDDLLSYMKTQSLIHKNEADNLKLAVKRLECMKEKTVNAVITCKDLGGNQGRALKWFGTGIELDPNAIRTGYRDYSWSTITLSHLIGSVILHEMSHKCGTNDKEYFALWNDPLTSAGKRWANVADLYSNMALWGMCMPGPECAARHYKEKMK